MNARWPLIHHVVDDFTEPWGDAAAPVLLHHGLAGNGNLFRVWVPAFASRRPVIRLDARGQGRTPLPDGYAFSLDGFVSDVMDVLDHHSVERVHWVGTSGGGIIGQHAAITKPERIASLTLVATTARFRAPAMGVDAWLSPLDRGDTDTFFRQDVDTRFGREHPERADWIINEIKRTPPETVAALHRWVIGVDLTGDIHRIACPALIITGERDTLTDLGDAGLMAERIPNARVHVIEGHPHNVGYTHPAMVAAIVRRFIDGVEEREESARTLPGGAYLGSAEEKRATTDEARLVASVFGLPLPDERAAQLAGTLSAFLGQQEQLRTIDVADHEPAVLGFDDQAESERD